MTVAFIRADALKALALHHQQKVSKQCDCTASACMGWDSVSDARWPQTQMQALATLRELGASGMLLDYQKGFSWFLQIWHHQICSWFSYFDPFCCLSRLKLQQRSL